MGFGAKDVACVHLGGDVTRPGEEFFSSLRYPDESIRIPDYFGAIPSRRLFPRQSKGRQTRNKARHG
jgi:hypothetical protein